MVTITIIRVTTMGEEVCKDHFEAEDYRQFKHRLEQEIAFVRGLFAAQRFDHSGRKLGYELELCLLDQQGDPAPFNQQLLQQARNPSLTVELARFNLEINGHAFAVHAHVFSEIETDLNQLYHQVEQVAERLNIRPGLFGVLPSLTAEHLQKEHYMSDLFRYRLLNERLMQLRQRPLRLEIHGADELSIEKHDVMLEALGTSLQVHYQIPFKEAVDSYHAALWASMAMLAAAANSSLVLQKLGWQESRIAIFKQAVDTRSRQEIEDKRIPRVHLAKGYVTSWLELFEDNAYYSPVLPEVRETPVDQLHHFNLHNGTIWRWVRPILGLSDEGQYHLRLELRVAPAGPTRLDTLANLVLYVGLIEGLKLNPQALTQIPYQQLEQDFYKVAREGLEASVCWCDGSRNTLQHLLLEKLIPLAAEGLQRIGIENPQQWLNIIQQRVKTGRTGARWISEFWQKHHDERALVMTYLNYAQANTPVHLWPKP